MPAATQGRELPAGIYTPTVTFFKPTKAQELDLESFAKHMENQAKSGIHGVTVQGSTGEAVALTRDERKQLIKIAKDTFRKCGNNGAIIAGTVGAQSTAEAITLAKDAAEAGAEFILALPASYYPSHMDNAALAAFYEELADESPIPVLIYSFPSVSSGIQLSTELTFKLAKHPNIVGIKHTDHDLGRITREVSLKKTYGSPFTVLGGATDYLLATLAVGGQGAITGMSNVTPRAIGKVYELGMAGKSQEALELAGMISRAEYALGKGGLLAGKWITAKAGGFPESAALARRPLLPITPDNKAFVEEYCKDIIAVEKQLEKEGYTGLGLRA